MQIDPADDDGPRPSVRHGRSAPLLPRQFEADRVRRPTRASARDEEIALPTVVEERKVLALLVAPAPARALRRRRSRCSHEEILGLTYVSIQAIQLKQHLL